MPNLIWFEWEKCPDGYSIETLEQDFVVGRDDGLLQGTFSPSQSAPAWVRALPIITPNDVWRNYLVPKSDRVLRFEPLKGNDAAFMEYAECFDSVSNLLRFVEKYGPPHQAQYPDGSAWLDNWVVEDNQNEANWMRDAVLCWDEAKQSGDYRRLIHSFNTATFFDTDEDYDEDDEGMARMRLRLRSYPGVDLPTLSVVPSDLDSALWLQFAQAVSANTQLQRCAVCPTWFAYGTGTGRRKSAHYCSDKCRKAAHRQRKSNG